LILFCRTFLIIAGPVQAMLSGPSPPGTRGLDPGRGDGVLYSTTSPIAHNASYKTRAAMDGTCHNAGRRRGAGRPAWRARRGAWTAGRGRDGRTAGGTGGPGAGSRRECGLLLLSPCCPFFPPVGSHPGSHALPRPSDIPRPVKPLRPIPSNNSQGSGSHPYLPPRPGCAEMAVIENCSCWAPSQVVDLARGRRKLLTGMSGTVINGMSGMGSKVRAGPAASTKGRPSASTAYGLLRFRAEPGAR
jgi:hypothetical protein